MGAYLGHAAQLTIKVTMVNAAVVKEKSLASLGHSCVLLVGDADNKVVYRSRVRYGGVALLSLKLFCLY